MIAAVDTHEVLAELKAGLSALYGQRLRGFYLFGSYARGQQGAESDFDILIVLDSISRVSEEVRRTGGLVSACSLKHGVSISRTFLREREWQSADTPLVRNVRPEAISA
jgi:predicted nucleotidyltransferase